MQPNHTEQHLTHLFTHWCKQTPTHIAPLPASASYRQYFRLQNANFTAIGAYNLEEKSNAAFINLTKHFNSLNLPVPQLYGADEANKVYLQEDLGDLTLFDLVKTTPKPENGQFPPLLLHAYQHTLQALLQLQITGSQNLNFGWCHPRAAFDKQSMMWDCSYFKYNFLKFLKIDFDEQALEDDFNRLTDYLLAAESRYFMHRDCQARNVMLKDGKPYLIDYQGGRRGALQYDLASLLYQAQANLPDAVRLELLQDYMQQAANMLPGFNERQFTAHYYGFVLLRCLQLLGAYGFRGLHERKLHFIQSIPFALQNTLSMLQKTAAYLPLPAIHHAIATAMQQNKWQPANLHKNAQANLTVHIQSFSYRNGTPQFNTEHGGGFVFDCRALLNPGRYDDYRFLSGLDKPVADFLKTRSNVEEWLSHVFELIDTSVENYLQRNFAELHVAFGCTGGQHRSVYCAQQLAVHLQTKYGVKVLITHTQKNNWITAQ
ncbi:phosphotransferase enzyme family protein [Sphingobacteriales bacterium UPWRP_1]|nr:hypothetical protein BVG80_17290 [Sphingobacteriales bacterium TSM_CSM]PSJ74190.1 phosphotransferase enzyme family protein [Sphingobacteriales bacterium UPWRP_1]